MHPDSTSNASALMTRDLVPPVPRCRFTSSRCWLCELQPNENQYSSARGRYRTHYALYAIRRIATMFVTRDRIPDTRVYDACSTKVASSVVRGPCQLTIPTMPKTLGESQIHSRYGHEYFGGRRDLLIVKVSSTTPMQVMALCCQMTHARHQTIASPITNCSSQFR